MRGKALPLKVHVTRDLGQRFQYEEALQQIRMRQCQNRGMHRDTWYVQEIDIDGPRPPMLVTHTAELLLDAEAASQAAATAAGAIA